MITNHSYPPDKCTFELLSAYLDGEVTSEQRQQVQLLLKQDPEIQALYQRLLALREGFRDLPVPEPEYNSQQLSNAVFAKIDRQKRQKRKWLIGGGAIAAVVVTAISGVVNPNRFGVLQFAQESDINSEGEGLVIALNEPLIELPTDNEALDIPLGNSLLENLQPTSE